MSLIDMSLDELKAVIKDMRLPAFRAGQIYSWLHKGEKPEGMTNLPLNLRQQLSNMEYGGVSIISQKKAGETIKYLNAASDGNVVESVFMRYRHGNTLCISSQAGCRMGCLFCASTIDGLARNLTAGEMLSQVLECEKLHKSEDGGRAITNIVIMGSGEPLDNYENTLKFLRLVTSPDGINISRRNISVSTCGIVPKMYSLADEEVGVNLSVSLHAPNDDIRRSIMPSAAAWSVEEIMRAADYYAKKTGRRVIIEYIMIDGINCSKKEALELSRLVKGRNMHINLISLNRVEERDLMPPSRETAEAFLQELLAHGVSATKRRELGLGVDGACGQLRRSFVTKGEA
ncbi:MAG: 23S rRNA (adenine(2503)-C(2))-methyltransferase RlmN [Christensenellales bacterium]|jgi:23S rRNA (adenine2503-C2)-methyltransferase